MFIADETGFSTVPRSHDIQVVRRRIDLQCIPVDDHSNARKGCRRDPDFLLRLSEQGVQPSLLRMASSRMGIQRFSCAIRVPRGFDVHIMV